MRRRTLLKNDGAEEIVKVPCDATAKVIKLASDSPIKIENAKVGNILTYNSGKIWMCNSTGITGTPIGVCVVPTSHNIYGDNTCAVMSLNNMASGSPEVGIAENSSSAYLCWGDNSTDISEMDNFTNVCHVGNSGNVNATIQGMKSYAYLPSDRTDYTAVDNPYDVETNYRYNDSDYYIPSPYDANGDFNPIYSQTTSPCDETNALSDFCGFGNTAIMTQYATAQTDWKTDSTITNSYSSGYYPSACCCWKYHTDGTTQGDWYLPACGELGYMIVRQKAINEAINKCGVGVQLISINYYWSSSEYSSGYARGVGTSNGDVLDFNKSYDSYVRAFLRVGGA